MVNSNVSKILIGRSRKFLAPYLDLMDAWRRDFVPKLVKGMIQAEGLVVTEIARALRQPEEALEAVWQRVRRHVASREWGKYETAVRQRFAQDRVAGIHDGTPVVVDLSDLSKPYAQKMEFLATVRDADESSLRKTLVLNPGYWLFESDLPLGRQGDPLPVVCFPFSVEDPRIGSQNRAIDQGLELLRTALAGRGILIFDRGFDSDVVFGLLEAKQLRFLCRLVGNRTLLDAERHSWGLAEVVAERTSLTHEMPCEVWKDHSWHRRLIRLGWRSVRLPDTGELYTLIVAADARHPEGRLLLLTNVPVHTFLDAFKLLRHYYLRWRTEDAIRILKTQLGLETVRVHDFDSIRRLIEFAFWILALISLITIGLDADQKRRITRAAAAWPTPILLFHYRIFALLRSILSRHGPSFLHPGRPKSSEV